jgi:hypothetical protein
VEEGRSSQVAAELAGDMHRPQGVLETRVSGGRIDPAGALALELVDAAESLEPGGVDQIPFRLLAVPLRHGHGKRGVPVNRIGDQRHPLISARIFD